MRTRIVVFTLLATLMSTLLLSVVLYARNKRAVTDRVATELGGLSSEAAREMGAWVDQRVYDLRLRAAPYVVSDNLARMTAGGRGGAQALARLRDYLNSIRQNLPGHEGLAIIDPNGQVLTSSGSRTGFRLTAERLNNLRTRDALVGDPFWDASIDKTAIVLVVPIRRDDGLFLGSLGGKINLDGMRDTLQQLAGAASRRIYIITEQGHVVLSSSQDGADVMKIVLPEAATRDLVEREGRPVAQARAAGPEVLAVLRRIRSCAGPGRETPRREIRAIWAPARKPCCCCSCSGRRRRAHVRGRVPAHGPLEAARTPRRGCAGDLATGFRGTGGDRLSRARLVLWSRGCAEENGESWRSCRSPIP